jgi:hypothetical protein
MEPERFVIAWQGRQLRIRHDDPTLDPLKGNGQQVRAAVHLASDVEGLRRALTTALGRQYRVRVSDDGTTVGLWRLRRGEVAQDTTSTPSER